MLMAHGSEDPRAASCSRRRCGSCHNFRGPNPFPKDDPRNDFFESWIPQGQAGNPTGNAGRSRDFGTEAWVRQFAQNPMDSKHLAATSLVDRKTTMEVIRTRMTRRSRCTHSKE